MEKIRMNMDELPPNGFWFPRFPLLEWHIDKINTISRFYCNDVIGK